MSGRSAGNALAGFLLVSSLALGCHRGSEEFGRLTVAEVSARSQSPGVFLYDNNPHSRFLKSHLPGARWVDPAHVGAGDLPSDREATLIFYCANEH
jgi:hypothetical protein